MKKRNCFVSNSSSSSFIVDIEKDGKCFHQLINLMKTFREDTIFCCSIYFNLDNVKIDDIFKIYKAVKDEFCLRSNRQGDKSEQFLTITFSKVYLLNYLNKNLIENIEKIYCSFHDSCDIGEYAESIAYKKLKDLGISFTWHGK